MIKKVYQKPAIDIFAAELEDQLLVASQIEAIGLDEDLKRGDDADMEENAW